MKREFLYRSVLFVLLMVLPAIACQPSPEPGPEVAVALLPDVTTEQVIGRLIRERDKVEHASPGQDYEELTGETELRPDHQIAVRDNGEALLDFQNAMRVILFNNTGSDVSMRAAEGSPSWPRIRSVLRIGSIAGARNY
jgi:hypothetical protein